jgi:hypothetical protein
MLPDLRLRDSDDTTETPKTTITKVAAEEIMMIM